VLVVGAGPVGLAAALALRRNDIDVRVIDRQSAPTTRCKAVGIQPRTLEVWEDLGLLIDAVDAGRWMRGQVLVVDGREESRLELWAEGLPYGFLSLPQEDTERVLADHLVGLGGAVERSTELVVFDQDADEVNATLRTNDGDRVVRARFLIGCDGAHSTVRRQLGLSFRGGRFAEQFMLGDVELDWSLPTGYAVRILAHPDGDPGRAPQVLVAIPLPGRGRYRLSMLAPPSLTGALAGPDHGLATTGPAPALADVQAVLDRLAPAGTHASNLRWSSLFGISHRIVERYSVGRVFLAGDAAHIHPPTGAQGMNTGIQDAYNLAWKLALAVTGAGAPELLDSYDAERRPVGEQVVGRTVARAGSQYRDIGQASDELLWQEGQLLVGYPDSPIVGPVPAAGEHGGGPPPGARVPDLAGFGREGFGRPLRLRELTGGAQSTLLVQAEAPLNRTDVLRFERLADDFRRRAGRHTRAYLILPAAADEPDTTLPVVRDRAGAFAGAFPAGSAQVLLVRPDGYLGYRGPAGDQSSLDAHLDRVFALWPDRDGRQAAK